MKDFLVEDLIKIFKALADRTRLRIVWLLCRAECEVCVCEIMDSLKESQYNISRHIKILKGAGLVRENKEGRWVYYSLVNLKNNFQDFILKAVKSISDDMFKLDEERLRKRLSLRVNGRCVVGMNREEWIRLLNTEKSEKM
ncbi:MAG: ArsR/SmtB family transcription factor [Spirochaetota bacterium]